MGLFDKILKVVGAQKEYRQESAHSFIDILTDKGIAGEFFSFMKLANIAGEQRALFNVYLPKSDGTTTEVDIIILHETGIYVLESKNYSGWIFGNGNNKNWTQSFPNRKKYSFYNPIKQNEGHIRALRDVIPNLPENYFKNVIVFSERCTLKSVTYTQENTMVLKRDKLKNYIGKEFQTAPPVLTTEEITYIYDTLKTFSKADDQTKKRHQQAINNKKS